MNVIIYRPNDPHQDPIVLSCKNKQQRIKAFNYILDYVEFNITENYIKDVYGMIYLYHAWNHNLLEKYKNFLEIWKAARKGNLECLESIFEVFNEAELKEFEYVETQLI